MSLTVEQWFQRPESYLEVKYFIRCLVYYSQKRPEENPEIYKLLPNPPNLQVEMMVVD
jgi:hypothetical protein